MKKHLQEHHLKCALFHKNCAKTHQTAAAECEKGPAKTFHESMQSIHAEHAGDHLDAIKALDSVDRGGSGDVDTGNLDGTRKIAIGSPAERAEAFDKLAPTKVQGALPDHPEYAGRNRLISRTGGPPLPDADEDPTDALDEQLAKIGASTR